jgi:thiol-disulfide isomerase/thioredoxin
MVNLKFKAAVIIYRFKKEASGIKVYLNSSFALLKLSSQKTSMKNFLLLFAFILSAAFVKAQKDSSAKNLSKFETIPAFNIYIVPDSTSFSNKNLKANKPFVIMFFSPDCEHCQKETKELLAYKDELRDIPILMASPSSFGMIKQFYEEYNLAAMPNIKLGSDVNYALGSIYQLRTFPSIFIYDHKGKLAKAFVGNAGVPAILDALK